MRHSKTVETKDPRIRERLLAWVARNNVFCVLNSNRDNQLFADPYSSFDFIVAAGKVDDILLKNPDFKTDDMNQGPWFEMIRRFHEEKKDWLFGFLTYDLKNSNSRPGEHLHSENHDGLEFPGLYFFQPRYIIELTNEKLRIEYLLQQDDESSVQKMITEILETDYVIKEQSSEIRVQAVVTKQEYIQSVEEIKRHIQRGDIYEMNYCVEFFAEDTVIQPLEMYLKLNEISPMPFSCFGKMNDHFLMCASPERFLAKRGTKIISQPIKGTARRGMNETEDDQIKVRLRNDPKEQSENVMIVDLVRNDLSRTAAIGSVHVEEIFEVYTFRQLHQMISTVVSTIREDVHFTDVIRHAFPMGSMTGAPKVRAMQLIEEFEETKRGLYSGSVGYITPDGDFDLNVVIRTIFFNSEKKYLTFMVGSAITANSIPEKEYDECLLKANAILNVLSKQGDGRREFGEEGRHKSLRTPN